VCLWDWVYFYGIAKGSLSAGGGTLPPSLRLFGVEWSWELPIACITYLEGWWRSFRGSCGEASTL
jgi:hypothetical protein